MWSNAPALEHCLRCILSADVSERWRRSQNAQIQHEALYHGNSPLKRKSSKGKASKKGAADYELTAQKQVNAKWQPAPTSAPRAVARRIQRFNARRCGVIGRAGVGTIIGHDTCSGILGTEEGQDGMPLESR